MIISPIVGVNDSDIPISTVCGKFDVASLLHPRVPSGRLIQKCFILFSFNERSACFSTHGVEWSVLVLKMISAMASVKLCYRAVVFGPGSGADVHTPETQC